MSSRARAISSFSSFQLASGIGALPNPGQLSVITASRSRIGSFLLQGLTFDLQLSACVRADRFQVGMESICMRNEAAASSISQWPVVGNGQRYSDESVAAATIAESLMRTP